jgi:transposase
MPTRNPYPSDVPDEECAFLAPYPAQVREEDAPQRTHNPRRGRFFDGLGWDVRAGSPWRYVPRGLPPWEAVYQQTRRWLSRRASWRRWSKIRACSCAFRRAERGRTDGSDPRRPRPTVHSREWAPRWLRRIPSRLQPRFRVHQTRAYVRYTDGAEHVRTRGHDIGTSLKLRNSLESVTYRLFK